MKLPIFFKKISHQVTFLRISFLRLSHNCDYYVVLYFQSTFAFWLAKKILKTTGQVMRVEWNTRWSVFISILLSNFKLFSFLRSYFSFLRSYFPFLRSYFSFLRSYFPFLRSYSSFLRSYFSFLRSYFSFLRSYSSFLRSYFSFLRPTPPIDPEILRTMVVKGFIGQAPNPGNRLRNQVGYSMSSLWTERFWNLMAFLKNIFKIPDIWRSSKQKRQVPESPMNRGKNFSHPTQDLVFLPDNLFYEYWPVEKNPFSSLVPKIYRRVEMRYSKLGMNRNY